MKKTIQLLQSKWREYLIELIVIIVGILLAIALNNWNEKRKMQVEEQIILKDLQSDFKDDLKQLHVKIDGAKKSDANINRIASNYINQKNANYEKIELDSLPIALLLRPSFDPKVGDLNDLLSSGKLRIIQNRELRKLLSSWPSHLQEANEIEERLHETRERIHDYLLENFPMADLFYASNNWRKIDFKSNFSMDHDLIFNDIKFENLLSLKNSWHKYIFRRYDILDKEIQKILTLIENEIQ